MSASSGARLYTSQTTRMGNSRWTINHLKRYFNYTAKNWRWDILEVVNSQPALANYHTSCQITSPVESMSIYLERPTIWQTFNYVVSLVHRRHHLGKITNEIFQYPRLKLWSKLSEKKTGNNTTASVLILN